MAGGLATVAVRSLRRRPLRGVLVAVAVAIGVAAVVGVQLGLGGLDAQAAADTAARAGRSDLDVRSVAGRGLGADDLGALAALPGVARVDPLLEKRVAAAPSLEVTAAVTLTVVGTAADGAVAGRGLTGLRGRLPVAVRDGAREVALDTAARDALAAAAGRGIGLGESVALTTATGPDRFTVVGIADGTAGGAGFTRAAAFVPDDDARGVFALGLHAPLAALELTPGADRAAVVRGAAAVAGGAVSVTDPRDPGVAPLQPLRPLLALVVVLSVGIAVGVTANAVAVGAVERRRELGLLRAAGASRRQVHSLLLAEVVLCSLVGGVAGLGVGAALGAALARGFGAPALPSPALAVSPAWAVGAVALGIAAALVGALVPAVVSTRVHPLDALRAGPGAAAERPSPALLRVAALAAGAGTALLAVGRVEPAAAGAGLVLAALALTAPRIGPPLLRALGRLVATVLADAPLAAASLARRRSRTGPALGALLLAVASSVAIAGLTEGALGAGDTWVSSLFAGDTVLTSPVTARDPVADQLALRADAEVGRLRFLAAPVDGRVTGITAADLGPFAAHGGLDVVGGDRATALGRLASGAAVLAPVGLAASRGWHPGTVVGLDPGDGGGPVAVTVVALVTHGFPAGDGSEGLLMERGQAVRVLGPAAAGFDALQVVDGDAGSLRGLAAQYGMATTSVGDLREAVRASLAHGLGLLAALGWLGVLAAMLGVVTTVVVDVAQGTHELALLRAAGLSRREALRLVLLEAGLLATAGLVVGVSAGMAVAAGLRRAVVAPGFDPPLVLPVGATAAAAAAVLLGALLAAVLPARRASRAAIVAAIRSE